MLVDQIYTAESGVCATCFVTALNWNKDRLLHQTQRNFLFLTVVCISSKVSCASPTSVYLSEQELLFFPFKEDLFSSEVVASPTLR